MRLHVIACQVFRREFSFFIAKSPHIIDITWLPQGLHNTPGLLRETVSEAITAAAAKRTERHTGNPNERVRPGPDAIVLGYGLCSNGVVGLTAPEIPLIIPKTDDCIALFLGSQQRYLELFESCGGTYWLNSGWIESAFIPAPDRYAALRAVYAELYGEDNADYLLEQECLWTQKYSRCGYISSDIYENEAYRSLAREIAVHHGWGFRETKGDNALIDRLLNGPWDESAFLVCPPGHSVEATFGPDKIRAVLAREQ